jgi:phenylalanyl-tRNA synthetase beta chain
VRFSRHWLADWVETPSTEGLAEQLTACGMAVEGVEERGEDVVLDVDVTANRPDAMCHRGLARELAVATGAPLTPPPNGPREEDEPTAAVAEVAIEDGHGCPRYVARVVRGVRVGPSPAWLAARLEAIGLRPINNVVDVTNYVLWELGQPLHAFDLASLAGRRIIVRRARPGERLVTLDGVERALDSEVLVIADAERPVALAGVMGGRDTEVTAGTTDVLLESAHFDPRRVRRGSARLGLHTDASHRFERGADPGAPVAAAARAAALLAEIASARVLAGAIDVTTSALPGALAGVLDRRRLSAFAGLEVAAAQIERILAGLGFGLERLDADRWRVEVPSWRHYDFREVRPDGGVWEADLFEEVLRHVGLDRIPSALPPAAEPDAGSSAPHELRERIRRQLAACGLAEAVNYAFYGATDDTRAPDVWRRAAPLALANPLAEPYALLRRSLVPGLTEAARFNARRGATAARLFEIGHLFPGGAAPEVETVAIVAGGTLGSPWQGQRILGLLDVKGCIESLAAAFGIEVACAPAALAGVVGGTGAVLVARGRTVGWLGRLEEAEVTYPLFAAELETAPLAEAPRFLAVTPPSRFPGVAMDLTLTHALAVAWSDLAAAIEERRPPELVAFELADRYRGAGVPPGCVNTTIAFLYNASDRSLTQHEVNARHTALAEELGRRFGPPGPTGE